MTEPDMGRSEPTAAQVKQIEDRAAKAGRWFSGYLVMVGVVSAAWLVLMEVAFSEGLARVGVSVGWAAAMLLANWWAERHAAFPIGASRHTTVAFVVWFALYLLLIGPWVRGRFGDEVLPWAVASVLMSTPFFIAAGLMGRRR